MIGKRTLIEWHKESKNYVKFGPDNSDSLENPDPDTVVSVKYMMKLHKRILRLTKEIGEKNI